MIARINREDNLEVREAVIGSRFLGLIYLLGGVLFIFGGFAYYILPGEKIFRGIILIFFGILGIKTGFPRRKPKNNFTFYRDTNKLDYWQEDKFYSDVTYYHIDILKSGTLDSLQLSKVKKNVFSPSGDTPLWDVVIFVKQANSPIIRIPKILHYSTAVTIKKFCTAVLQKNTNYKPPSQSLEDRIEKGATFDEAVAAAVHAMKVSSSGIFPFSPVHNKSLPNP